MDNPVATLGPQDTEDEYKKQNQNTTDAWFYFQVQLMKKYCLYCFYLLVCQNLFAHFKCLYYFLFEKQHSICYPIGIYPSVFTANLNVGTQNYIRDPIN